MESGARRLTWKEKHAIWTKALVLLKKHGFDDVSMEDENGFSPAESIRQDLDTICYHMRKEESEKEKRNRIPGWQPGDCDDYQCGTCSGCLVRSME